jgi:acyl-CoA reductase-like NAD-dependent aldehyde dehydrogenase
MSQTRTLQVHTAYDEQPMAELPLQSRDECLALLADSRALYEDRDAWLPPHERLAILKRLSALIAGRVEPLAKQAAAEGGKPLVDSLVEVRRAVEGVESAIAALRTQAGEQVPLGFAPGSTQRMAFTYREPRGPVVAISAFNHPFNLIVHQVVPAVAVGAPVLVKPASTTPLSCKALVELLYEAGLPERFCRMVVCETQAAEALVSDPCTAFLSFIGSGSVGWHLRSKLPPGAACALEHGGVAPVIVDDSADLEDAIPLLLKGGYYHAGQVCVSVQRVFVHESIRDHFVERFAAGARALRVGDPLSESTEVGPLILPREVERVQQWVSDAVSGGAKLVCGGERLGRTTYAPTLLLEPPSDANVSMQEVFGPVVCVYGYRDLDDAIARANAPDAFFQAAIFTQRYEAAMRAFSRLRGMAVMVNDHTAFRVDWMPFGGHMSSGLGSGGIPYSMRDMSLERMVVFRSKSL